MWNLRRLVITTQRLLFCDLSTASRSGCCEKWAFLLKMPCGGTSWHPSHPAETWQCWECCIESCLARPHPNLLHCSLSATVTMNPPNSQDLQFEDMTVNFECPFSEQMSCSEVFLGWLLYIICFLLELSRVKPWGLFSPCSNMLCAMRQCKVSIVGLRCFLPDSDQFAHWHAKFPSRQR